VVFLNFLKTFELELELLNKNIKKQNKNTFKNKHINRKQLFKINDFFSNIFENLTDYTFKQYRKLFC